MSHHATLNHPFWQYSLQIYAADGMEELCLTLQNEHEIDVNILLFSTWLATQYRILDISLLEQNTRLQYWQNTIIPPVRQARIALGNHERNHTLYTELKTVELRAEQEVQAILWSMHHEFALCSDSSNVTTIIRQNIEHYWTSIQKIKPVSEKTHYPIPLMLFCDWMLTDTKGKI